MMKIISFLKWFTKDTKWYILKPYNERGIGMKVLGYGDNVTDFYVEEGVYYPGGNALNFCIYMKELGADAHYLGNYADDFIGKHIQEIVKNEGLGDPLCKEIKNSVTEVCPIIIRDNDRIFVEEDLKDGIADMIVYDASMDPYMQSFDLVHVGCYAYKPHDVCAFVLPNTLLSYDFSVEDEYHAPEYYEPLCKNIDFALFSSTMNKEDTKELMRKMVKAGCKNVLATRGMKGQLFYNDGIFYEGDVEKVDAVDTCGAGDSFVSAFLYSLLNDGYRKNGTITEDMVYRALALAKAYSAKNCMRKGAFGRGLKKEEC